MPFWSAYERGGGGATKRAVAAWIDGISPWNLNRKLQDVRRYFEAGGNGVAMRVLPHIIHLNEKMFNHVAHNIVRDGITTHGHPRALLGALVYGYALWVSFRRESKLGYGELVEDLIQNVDSWSAIPEQSKLPSDWWDQAESMLKDYSIIWESTKIEILEYLRVCQSEMAKGALSFDDDALHRLQCFNKKISGAGTVAAISSVYLASHYAAAPLHGVIRAAFAIGSDTDTIASMTGGLLGCINGMEWLLAIKSGVQDSAYLEKTALKLISDSSKTSTSYETIKRTLLKNWLDNVVKIPDASDVTLPDGRKANVSSLPEYVARSGKYKVEFRKFITEDGQSIYVNKISKGDFSTQPLNIAPLPENIQVHPYKLNLGPKLPVSSIEQSVRFYKEVLGLTIKKQSKDVAVFHQGLVLAPAGYIKQFAQGKFRSLLYVEVTEIEKRYHWILNRKSQVVSPLEYWGQQSTRRFFRCFDPDGNIVEVFEKQ